MNTRRALVVLGLCCACRAEDVELVPRVDGGAPTLPGLISLRVTPPSVTLVEDGRPPALAPVTFRAFGTFAEGEREVSADVAWSFTPVELGSLDAGILQPSGAGGRGTVTASADGISGTAELEVRLDVIEAGEGLTPEDVALFPSDTSSDTLDLQGVTLLYPSHEVELPQNLGRLDVEWSSALGLDRFQVLIESPRARVRAQVRGAHLTLAQEAWTRLAVAHAGANVELRVRGLSSANPMTIYTSAPITVGFSVGAIPGALYYWSSTTRSIMRARLDAPLATRAFPSTSSGCVGCHTLRRDGRGLVYVEDNHLAGSSLPERVRDFPPGGGEGRDATSAAYSPDGRWLLVADREHLELVDATSGALISEVSLPNDRRVAQPDWSPDGTKVALAYLASADEELREHFTRTVFEGTSLAVLDVDAAGNFGSPQVLVRSNNEDDTVYAPAFSPDGSVIAFTRARGRSKDNRRAEVFLIRTDGVGGPVALARLNRRGGGTASITEAGNSHPVWAPSSRPGEAWLAFGSVRPVGEQSVTGHDQLWVAAIDLSRVSPGDDPSAAAFWMPFQSLAEANHRPLWSSAATDTCASTVDVCGNGLDDDCSGQADDACCTVLPEVCGDQTDNDCDGVADEGCGCALTEACTNLVDDDCDGRIDGADDDCRD